MFDLGKNPAIGLENRKWLVKMSADNYFLDDISRDIIIRVLDKCRKYSPCGTVYEIAMSCGSTKEMAEKGAAISEMFYALCYFTDDIQDGDTDEYMYDVPFSIRLNTQAQMLCLMVKRVQEMARKMAPKDGLEMVVDIYGTGAAMLNGQRKELARAPWNIEVYEEVARLSAGEQYAVHFGLAARAAGAETEVWRRFGRAFGTLLQVVVDAETGDERLTMLEAEKVVVLKKKAIAELKEASIPIREKTKRYQEALLDRCSSSSLGRVG